MNEIEKKLLETFLELEEEIKGMANKNPKPSLQPYFQRIEQLTTELPRGTDPSLLHYLHKKSYEKARLWLQGREAENARGSCGH